MSKPYSLQKDIDLLQANNNNKKTNESKDIIELKVSLEDLYQGANKKLKITRQRINLNDRAYYIDSKMIEIAINPGMKPGTMITLPEEGDQLLITRKAKDLTLVIVEKLDPRFIRQGKNLIHKRAITLKEALIGVVLTLPSVCGTSIELDLHNEVPIAPGFRSVIPGKGMRDSSDGERGDYFVEISVVFPTTKLTTSQIQTITELDFPTY